MSKAVVEDEEDPLDRLACEPSASPLASSAIQIIKYCNPPYADDEELDDDDDDVDEWNGAAAETEIVLVVPARLRRKMLTFLREHQFNTNDGRVYVVME